MRRPLDDGKEVDVRCVGSDRVVQQVRVRPHPELQRPRVGQRGQVAHRHDAAEGAGAGVDRPLLAGHVAAHGRAGAVGADDDVGLGARPIGEVEADDAVALLDPDDLVPEMLPLRPVRCAEHPLQVGAVYAEVRRAEPPPIDAAQRHRVRRGALSGAPVPPDQLGRLRGDGGDRVEAAGRSISRVPLADSATAAPISRSSTACS